jgi:hypothetical protein
MNTFHIKTSQFLKRSSKNSYNKIILMKKNFKSKIISHIQKINEKMWYLKFLKVQESFPTYKWV